jgi:ribonuclease HI
MKPKVTWQKPPEGVYKINWDTSVDRDRCKMGMGLVVRDHAGQLIAALCASKDHITDPTSAEALAASKAAELCHRLGLEKVILEGDAVEVDWDISDRWCLRHNNN